LKTCADETVPLSGRRTSLAQLA